VAKRENARLAAQMLQKIAKVRVASVPRKVLLVGELDAVVYQRNGDKYIHRFRNRPFLCADPQGKQLFIVGGKYLVK